MPPIPSRQRHQRPRVSSRAAPRSIAATRKHSVSSVGLQTAVSFFVATVIFSYSALEAVVSSGGSLRRRRPQVAAAAAHSGGGDGPAPCGSNGGCGRPLLREVPRLVLSGFNHPSPPLLGTDKRRDDYHIRRPRTPGAAADSAGAGELERHEVDVAVSSSGVFFLVVSKALKAALKLKLGDQVRVVTEGDGKRVLERVPPGSVPALPPGSCDLLVAEQLVVEGKIDVEDPIPIPKSCKVHSHPLKVGGYIAVGLLGQEAHVADDSSSSADPRYHVHEVAQPGQKPGRLLAALCRPWIKNPGKWGLPWQLAKPFQETARHEEATAVQLSVTTLGLAGRKDGPTVAIPTAELLGAGDEAGHPCFPDTLAAPSPVPPAPTTPAGSPQPLDGAAAAKAAAGVESSSARPRDLPERTPSACAPAVADTRRASSCAPHGSHGSCTPHGSNASCAPHGELIKEIVRGLEKQLQGDHQATKRQLANLERRVSNLEQAAQADRL